MEVEIVVDEGKNDTDFEMIFEGHNFSDFLPGNYSYDREGKYESLRGVSDFMMGYYVPVVTSLGLVFNLVSFIVLLACRELRCYSRSVYLVALCVSDQSFLALLAMTTRSMAAIDLYNRVDALCKLLVYTIHLTEVGKWFVVLLLADTYLSVCHPRLAARFCSPRVAVAVVSAATAATAIYSIHSITQIGVPMGGNYCHYGDYEQTVRLHIADIVLLGVLPLSTLLLLFTLLLYSRLCGATRKPMTVQAGHNLAGSLALPITLVIIYLLILTPTVVIQCIGIYDFMHPGSLFNYHLFYFYMQQLIYVVSYIFFCCKPLLCVLCWEAYRRCVVTAAKDLWHQRVRLCARVPYTSYQEQVDLTAIINQ